jgi:lysophospholipase L1-like esterase
VKNGVDIKRFEKVYRMLIEDTKERLPNAKFMLLEPFVLKGVATTDKFEEFSVVYDYAKVVKNIANDYGLIFVPLQNEFNERAKLYGEESLLYDGVHPTIAGSTLIANEWMKVYKKEIQK